jgi:hypothetical protein
VRCSILGADRDGEADDIDDAAVPHDDKETRDGADGSAPLAAVVINGALPSSSRI